MMRLKYGVWLFLLGVMVVGVNLPVYAIQPIQSVNMMSPSYIEARKSKVIVTGADGRRYVKDWYLVTLQDELIDPPNPKMRGKFLIGEHSSGQSKAALARTLNLKGEIVSIIETINVISVKIDEKEALRLSRDKRVLRVRRNYIGGLATQNNPGWALDRLDETTAVLDNTYNDTPMNGAGRTIYILDTGLALSNPVVAAEFSGRASVLWDFNGGNGHDCHGHGTKVSSAAAGNMHGVAKGATIVMGKVTYQCESRWEVDTVVDVLDWLTQNAPRGSIINISLGLERFDNCTSTWFEPELDEAIVDAFDAGLIVVVAAGNDGCDVAGFSPTHIPEAFVVGSTNVPAGNPLFGTQHDPIALRSRRGANISTLAPGQNVSVMNNMGVSVIDSGTSFAAPYVAGLFATACQAAAPFCETATTAELYDAFRNTGMNTVTDPWGAPLIDGTPPRFISKQW